MNEFFSTWISAKSVLLPKGIRAIKIGGIFGGVFSGFGVNILLQGFGAEKYPCHTSTHQMVPEYITKCFLLLCVLEWLKTNGVTSRYLYLLYDVFICWLPACVCLSKKLMNAYMYEHVFVKNKTTFTKPYQWFCWNCCHRQCCFFISSFCFCLVRTSNC